MQYRLAIIQCRALEASDTLTESPSYDSILNILQDISVLDAIEAQYLAQREAANQSRPGIGSQAQPSSAFRAPQPAHINQPSQTHTQGPFSNGPSLAPHALHVNNAARPNSALGSSRPPAGGHAGGPRLQQPGALRQRWQQPAEGMHAARADNLCAANRLPGPVRPPRTHPMGQHQPAIQQQQRSSAPLQQAGPAQASAGAQPPEHASRSARHPASSWARCPSQQAPHRPGAVSQEPTRSLWEPGGPPQAAAALAAQPRRQPAQPAQQPGQAPMQAGPFPAAAPHARAQLRARFILPPGQLETRQTQPQELPQASTESPSHPVIVQPSKGIPPAAAAACDQPGPSSKALGHSAAFLYSHSISAALLSTVAAESANGVSGSSDATGVLAGDSTRAAQDAATGQGGILNIEWDDWQPEDDWLMEPLHPSQAAPVLEAPGTAGVPDTPEGAEDPGADAADAEPDSEPQLVPCKTATKGMQLDRSGSFCCPRSLRHYRLASELPNATVCGAQSRLCRRD